MNGRNYPTGKILNFWKALAALLKLTYMLPSTISFNMIYHDGMISTQVLTAVLI